MAKSTKPISTLEETRLIKLLGRAVAVALFLFASVASAGPASASEPEQSFPEMANRARAEHGLAPLTLDYGLIDVARRHSAAMAEAGRIFHNRNLPMEVANWVQLGENVGRGPESPAIHGAFMDSPTHRDQILHPDYRGMAVGVVVSGGTIYVTELFIVRGEVAAPKPSSPAAQRRVARAAPPPPAEVVPDVVSPNLALTAEPKVELVALEPLPKTKPSRFTLAPVVAAAFGLFAVGSVVVGIRRPLD